MQKITIVGQKITNSRSILKHGRFDLEWLDKDGRGLTTFFSLNRPCLSSENFVNFVNTVHGKGGELKVFLGFRLWYCKRPGEN